MTIPLERTRAVNATYEFLKDLLDREKTPRVPKEIRQRASACLRHYPNSFDMEVISKREDENTNASFLHKVFGESL